MSRWNIVHDRISRSVRFSIVTLKSSDAVHVTSALTSPAAGLGIRMSSVA
jgi:hypothetical protein